MAHEAKPYGLLDHYTARRSRPIERRESLLAGRGTSAHKMMWSLLSVSQPIHEFVREYPCCLPLLSLTAYYLPAQRVV